MVDLRVLPFLVATASFMPACSSGSASPEPREQSEEPAEEPTEQPKPPTACEEELERLGVEFVRAAVTVEHPPEHPDLDCTIENPVLLTPVIHGVTFRPTDLEQEPEVLQVSCLLGLALEETAAMLSERAVTDVAHYGTYGCKTIDEGSQLSEHAVGRAIDLAVFRTTSGDALSVLDDWRSDPDEQHEPGHLFLAELVQSLYDERVFNVILTPEFNADHHNHFHLDLTPGVRFMK